MDNALADKESHDRLRILDGLRAIAVLLVVFMHSIRAQWLDITQPFLNIPGDTLATILYNGWVGVDLFFVLSGFLIARQLLRFSPSANMSRARYFLYYLKVRFFRIAPAYYLTLIIFLAVSWGLRSAQGHMMSADQLSDWGTRLMAHILFMHDYFPPLKMSVLWSLAVEAKFYLLAPFLVGALYEYLSGHSYRLWRELSLP